MADRLSCGSNEMRLLWIKDIRRPLHICLKVGANVMGHGTSIGDAELRCGRPPATRTLGPCCLLPAGLRECEPLIGAATSPCKIIHLPLALEAHPILQPNDRVHLHVKLPLSLSDVACVGSSKLVRPSRHIRWAQTRHRAPPTHPPLLPSLFLHLRPQTRAHFARSMLPPSTRSRPSQ